MVYRWVTKRGSLDGAPVSIKADVSPSYPLVFLSADFPSTGVVVIGGGVGSGGADFLK